MAASMDTAAAGFDRTADNTASGKLIATSQIPKKATVEDYFSDNEPMPQNVFRKREDPNEPSEPRKPIIGNTSFPKRATVSWSDERHSRSTDFHDRTSRLSEALTAVPSNNDNHGRTPPARSGRRELKERYPSRQPRRSPERGYRQTYSPSDSEEENDWYRRSGARRNKNGIQPVPNHYAEFRTRDDRAIDEPHMHPYLPDHGPIYPRPTTRIYNHDAAQAPYYPAAYLRPKMESAMSGSTFVGDPAPRDLYYHITPPSYHARYPPLNTLPELSPPPPPCLQPASARRPIEAQQEENGASNFIQKNDLANHERKHAGDEAERTERYQNLMRNLQQTLDMYKSTRANSEDEVSPEHIPALSPGSSLAIDSQTQRSMTDLDLIKLMEERMQALKRKNEEKLIEANQVLAYLDRGSNKARQKLDNDIMFKQPGSVNNATTEVPNVHIFRTPEDETDHDDDSEDLESTDQDSMAGNSSGSSLLSLEKRGRQMDPSRTTTGIARNRDVSRDDAKTTEEVSTHNNDTDHGSIASESEASLEAPAMTEGGDSSELRNAPTQPTADNQIEHDVVEELIALRRDLSVLKRQITLRNQSWPGITLSALVTKWKKHLRKPPRLGTQRLEWTCECGDEMYADLPIENSAQYQQMLEFLTRSGTNQQTNQNQTTPSQLEGGNAPLDYTSLQSSQSSFGQGTSPASTIGSGSTYVGSSSSQSPNGQQNNAFARNKYLELCVNVGKYETKLAEIQISSTQSGGAAICTDAHLFRQIYHRYTALRRRTWRRFLYRPAGIKFVHFGVQAGNRVSFFSSDPLPPEDEIAAKRYEYSLNPPVPPPMDSRTFLHYFYKHEEYSHSTNAKWVNRLPKKLGDSLIRSLGVDDLLGGWGIHIIEGPNKVAICWALMIVLIASLGVSISYDLVTKSGDSGFAIGQWMVAALTVGLSALYFSLEDDVIQNVD